MSLALLKEEYSQEKFESFIKETFKIEEIDTRFKSDGLNQNHLEHIDAYKFIGRTRLSDKSRLGFFVFKSKNKNIEKKRVGFNAIIPSLTQKHIITHALVAIFHPESKVWRLSYVAFDTKDGKQTLNTSIKRYTYELGAGIPIKTAQNQLQLIVDSDKISKKILEEVFSVEKLNDRFFADYKRLFEKLNAYLSENNFANFERDNANIRGFSKKLLGRITFLYFLQKKGWLGAKKSWGDGDRRFLSKCFEGKYKKYDNFYDDILKDIFFKALNDDRRESDNLFKEFGKMPYLNGGLFSADGMDNDERLHIENTIFENIINTFDQYNFTIIEDTPHESEVAIDPEMLGKVFENLLEENYKSGKGAFYTPREIVHYMCKESIYEYLLPDALNKEAVRKLVFKGELDPTIETQKIKEKIEAIKILDPAIGSGAFPMGLLGELIHILQLLDENLDVVQAKIDIIQNSIYGIDIDPSAVEIAQLRFWLSIVVDEKKPRALPNLDFKIMIGNSLLETIHGNDPLKNRRGLDDKLNDLNQLFNSFYDPDADKNQLREKISQILQGIFKPLSKRYSTQAPLNTDAKKHKKDLDNAFKAKDIDNILKALSHKGFSNQIFLYKLFFKDILKSGGFNIIIGNPPYLRVQGIDKEASAQYKKQFDSATGKYDLYVLFVEKGLSLLAKNGILNYIMPHKWINSAFGKGLREISKDNLLKFISFGAYQVFNASTYTSLVWFKNSNVKTLEYVESDRDLLDNKALEKYLFELKDDDYSKIKNRELGTANWVFTDKKTYDILQKLNRQSLRVKDCFKYVSTGIFSNGDEVFFLQGNIENNLFRGYSKGLMEEIIIEADIMKPLLLGDDVKRYSKIVNTYYVIYPHYITSENKTKPYEEKELKSRFPLAYKYFCNFKEELTRRKIKNKNNSTYWYALNRARQIEMFEQAKIITPEISLGSNMSLDENHFYGNTQNYNFVKFDHVKESYKFYLAIFNSKLLWFFVKNTGSVLASGYFRFKTNYLNPFPLPKIENVEDTRPFEILVDYVMYLKTLDINIDKYADNENIIKYHFEEVINALVYELYFKDEFIEKDIEFLKYAKEYFKPIDNLSDEEKIEIIHNAYQLLTTRGNKIKDNLELMTIRLKDLILTIKRSI